VAADLGHVPLFAAMEPEDVTGLLERSSERRVHAGETLIEQWDTSRDFFVILDGRFRVRDGDRDIATVSAGDFVGELAALDWGAGYGAIRMAQVEAESTATVLVVTPSLLRDVLVRSEAARTLVERTARDRLAATG
jgi:CRP-like cAMP-binding protein